MLEGGLNSERRGEFRCRILITGVCNALIEEIPLLLQGLLDL